MFLRRFLLSLCCVTSLHVSVSACAGQVFNGALSVPIQQDATGVSVADVNGDGRPDVVYTLAGGASSSATAHTLLANASGGYTEAAATALPTGVEPLCTTGDLDGDGHTDLACTAAGSSTTFAIAVFQGRGDGTFAPPVLSPISDAVRLTHPLPTQVIDVSGDGKADLFLNDAGASWTGNGGSENTPSGRGIVLVGDGAGKLAFRSVVQGFVTGFVTLGDANGDGKLDMLFGSYAGSALGNGDGTFTQQLSTTGNIGCAYGDVDHDGVLDAMCAFVANEYGLYFVKGKGDGTFLRPTASLVPPKSSLFNAPATLSAMTALKDLNGDGYLDAVGYGGDGLTVYPGRPGATFDAPLHFAAGQTPFSKGLPRLYPSQQVVDMNGDGLPDVVGVGPNSVVISYGHRDLYLTAPQATEIAGDTDGVLGYLALADLNGDGKPDAIATGSDAVMVSLGKGDGSFETAVPQPRTTNPAETFGSTRGPSYNHIVTGDFNGDGKVDVLAQSTVPPGGYASYLLRGNGDGTLARPAPLSINGYWFNNAKGSSLVGDLNGDGRSDVLYLDSADGALYASVTAVAVLFAADGSVHTIRTPLQWPSAYYPYTSYGTASHPALADWNGDGVLDLAYTTLNAVYVLPGHGDGTFDTARAVTFPLLNLPGKSANGAMTNAAGDFDGDGKADLAVLLITDFNQNSGAWSDTADRSAIAVYFGKGDGTFTAGPVLSFNHAYSDAVGVHFNASAQDDLILRTEGNEGFDNSPSIAIVHANANRSLSLMKEVYGGAGLSTLQVADLDGNGKQDIVAGNSHGLYAAKSFTVLLNGALPAASIGGTLKATPEPTIAGDSFDLLTTFTAPGGAALAGTVQFTVDGNPVGSAALSGNAARLTVPGTAYAVGAHTLSATWPGDATHSAITLTGTHTITGIPSRVTASITPASAVARPFANVSVYAGQPAILNVTVTELSSGLPVDSGTVVFTEGSVVLGTTTLGTDGHGTITYTFLTGGTHHIGLSYSGSSKYAPSTGESDFVVYLLPTNITLASNANPSPALSPVGFTVTLSSPQPNVLRFNQAVSIVEGSRTLATGTLNANGTGTITVTGLNGGPHTLRAVFAGTDGLAASTSDAVVQTMSLLPSATVLTSSKNPSSQGEAVTFRAVVSVAANAQATGNVTFLDGTTPLATVQLINGAATLSTSSLALGSHTIAALYSGDPALATLSAASLTQVVNPSDFTLTATPTALTMRGFDTGTFTVTATQIGVFTDTLKLSLTGQQDGLSLTAEPATLSLGTNAAATSVISVRTGFRVNAQSVPRRHGAAVLAVMAGLPFGLLLLARGRRAGTLLMLLLGFLLSGSTIGCGLPPTKLDLPPGVYHLHVTATGAITQVAHGADVTLTVTP